MTRGDTSTHQTSYAECEINHRTQPHSKRKANICSKALSLFLLKVRPANANGISASSLRMSTKVMASLRT